LGIIFIFICSVMNAGTAVLNRSLKEVHYVIVLFFHSLFGILVTGTFEIITVGFFDRPIYLLDFTLFDHLINISASVIGAISVMSQTIAY